MRNEDLTRNKPSVKLPHEWDDDAMCIHCGLDGAESWHLTKFCGYEQVDSDKFCQERSQK